MTVEPVKCVKCVKCPKCASIKVIPDIGYDGKFGMAWCTQCKMEFSSFGPSWLTEMNALLPYARGFVLGYLVHAVFPQPYALLPMLVVCVTLILSGLGAFK